MTNSVMEMFDTVIDKETQNVVIKSMGEMTSGGKNFQAETKVKIATKLYSLLQSQLNNGNNNGGRRRRRRRRTIGSYEISAVSYTVEEVTIALSPTHCFDRKHNLSPERYLPIVPQKTFFLLNVSVCYIIRVNSFDVTNGNIE